MMNRYFKKAEEAVNESKASLIYDGDFLLVYRFADNSVALISKDRDREIDISSRKDLRELCKCLMQIELTWEMLKDVENESLS